MARRVRRHRRGAVLVEAMIGGVVLAIGLTALISTSTQSLARQKLGEEQLIAATLLDETLSRVLMHGPFDFPKREPLSGRFDPPFDNYEFQVEIVDQGDIDGYHVTAHISWMSSGGARSATVQTYMAARRGDPEAEVREPGEPISR